MLFKPAVSPPPEDNAPAFWFLFLREEIVIGKGDVPTIPILHDPASAGLHVASRQYLGTLDGRSCYAANLADQSSIPAGMTSRGVRQLYGRIEDELFWVAGRAYHLVNWDRTRLYCGRCGGATENLADQRAKVCPGCGQIEFPRISPAVIVAVVRGNELLLARAHRFPPGLFSVIAGFVEPGETLEECVRREVREEVGLEIEDPLYFGSQPWPFPDSLMIAYTAEYAGGEIEIEAGKIAEAGWFSTGHLPRVPDKLSIARRLIEWFVSKHGRQE